MAILRGFSSVSGLESIARAIGLAAANEGAQVVINSTGPGGGTATAEVPGASASATGASATAVAISSESISVLVGAARNNHVESMNCWKDVVKDKSSETSAGLLLSELLSDPRVVSHSVNWSGTLPEVTVTNKWNEAFQINVVAYNDDTVFMHAEKL